MKIRPYALIAVLVAAAACGRGSEANEMAGGAASPAPSQPAPGVARPVSSKPLIHVYKSPT